MQLSPMVPGRTETGKSGGKNDFTTKSGPHRELIRYHESGNEKRFAD
jgi:hypothetical protein